MQPQLHRRAVQQREGGAQLCKPRVHRGARESLATRCVAAQHLNGYTGL